MKHATAKRVPSTRCWSSACDDTSMATVRTPASRMRASRGCSSVASGVVWGTGSDMPSMRAPVVPMMPERSPAAAAIRSSRYVVVVFPFVPVTPSTRIARAGSPWNRAQSGPSTLRTEPTRACGTSTSSQRSTRHAVAPAATAAIVWSCPSVCAPGIQQKSAPGTTCRLSCTTARTTASSSPRTSTLVSTKPSKSSRPSRRSCRRTRHP